jgi:hypothetical protein
MDERPPRSRSSKVTLPDLVDFRTRSGDGIDVVRQIGVKYRNFGIFLLNDENGDIVDNIEADCRFQLIEIRKRILLKWLEGNGRYPVSWGTLVTVLRMIELNALAGDIADNLGKLVKYYIATNTKWCPEIRTK